MTRAASTYAEFLEQKMQNGTESGFAPVWMPDFLFDFQQALVEWATRKGRAAIFADCGLGKTPMQLVWAENVIRHTNGRVLIIAPLAVAPQTIREGQKFGITVTSSRDGQAHDGITITNYERLHHFNAADFVGVVCDESSILKHFSGSTQKHVTRFLSKLPYRLLCTATAAPNDYIELGTASEALGFLGYSDMLSRFFVMDDKKRHRMNDVKVARDARTGNHFAKLAYRVSQQIGAWRLKGHAEEPFWRWVCSWARAARLPSDLGFEDRDFILPELIERHHIVEPVRPPDGMLFVVPAFGLQEERDERRRTLDERCALVEQLVNHDGSAVVWCHLNSEGDLLEQRIRFALQVAGRHDQDYKEAVAAWFQGFQCLCADERFRVAVRRWNAAPIDGCRCGQRSGRRVLVSKPKVFGFGLNFQHCAHVVTFASHSYEQYYQAVRRCWRFGQTRPVTVDVISTTGEVHVRDSMVRKSAAAALMFEHLVRHMHSAMNVSVTARTQLHTVALPTWLEGTAL